MKAPRVGFLALATKRFYRTHALLQKRIDKNASTGQILIVISCPNDAKELAYEQEGYSIVFALQPFFNRSINVLRPPTFKNLMTFLAEHPDIAVIHFDGHGEVYEEGGYLV